MLAHDLVDRPTQDVDLFTPDPSEVTRLDVSRSGLTVYDFALPRSVG
ncbi:MAG TPA: hypothetical protein VK499_13850 [Propionibacteriaceae bacterium]|jgi:hypothetical protein|nr:hypothetical protein [Propionibacteriaceae bacterium]